MKKRSNSQEKAQFEVSKELNDNSEKILQEFDEVCDLLNRYIETIINDEKADGDPLDRSIKEVLRSLLNGKIIKFRKFIQDNFETFENNELTSILINHLRNFIYRILINNTWHVFCIFKVIRNYGFVIP